MSLKDSIIAATKPRIVDTETEINGEKLQLRFRAMKYSERKAVFQSKVKEVGRDKDGKPIMQIPTAQLADLNADFLATTLIDDDGNPVASKEEILKGWDAVIADKIAAAGSKALGLAEDDDKKEEEENPSTPNQESGTP